MIELLTKPDELLHAAAAVDAEADFDRAHQVFQELLDAADIGMLQLPDDKAIEQRVRDAWARYECVLEAERAFDVLTSPDPHETIKKYDLLPRYRKFLATDKFLLEQCSVENGTPHLLMIGSGPLPITPYIFGKSAGGFGYEVTNVDASSEALAVGQQILGHTGLEQRFQHATGADVEVDPSITSVIIAALAGTNKTEKLAIIANVATQLRSGGRISVRYGTGPRRLFYPECVLDDEECAAYGLRRIGSFEPPRDYMNAIGVYEKC